MYTFYGIPHSLLSPGLYLPALFKETQYICYNLWAEKVTNFSLKGD